MTQNSCLGYVPSGYNYIINPCFEVNQRGVASVTGNGAFPVDRWVSNTDTTGSLTWSQQAFTVGQTDVPGEPKNYLRAVVASDSTAGEYIIINHKIEDVRTLAGQTCVFSFWAKADASRSIAIDLYHNYGSGGSSSINSNGNNKIAVTTSWTRYSVTLTMPSLSGKTVGAGSSVWVNFWLSGGSTYNSRTGSLGNQSGTFEFANVKLEAGSTPTPFVVPRFGDELIKCMRYFKAFGSKTANWSRLSNLGNATSTTTAYIPITFDVPMRATPTLINPTNYANLCLSDGCTNIPLSANPTLYTYTQDGVLLTCVVASGLTAYRSYYITLYGAFDLFGLSAEV